MAYKILIAHVMKILFIVLVVLVEGQFRQSQTPPSPPKIADIRILLLISFDRNSSSPHCHLVASPKLPLVSLPWERHSPPLTY